MFIACNFIVKATISTETREYQATYVERGKIYTIHDNYMQLRICAKRQSEKKEAETNTTK